MCDLELFSKIRSHILCIYIHTCGYTYVCACACTRAHTHTQIHAHPHAQSMQYSKSLTRKNFDKFFVAFIREALIGWYEKLVICQIRPSNLCATYTVCMYISSQVPYSNTFYEAFMFILTNPS